MARNVIDKAVVDFGRSLVRFKNKIVKRSNGRMCGTCAHNIRGRCIEHHVDVFVKDAVACESHVIHITK